MDFEKDASLTNITELQSNANIVTLNADRKFTLEEANAVLPLVYRITEVAQKEVRDLVNKLDALKHSKSDKKSVLEEQINAVVQKWESKVTRLGAHPKGLWLADFDSGEGYYCWKFPETEIKFWHGYHDGFSGRKALFPH